MDAEGGGSTRAFGLVLTKLNKSFNFSSWIGCTNQLLLI